MHGASCFFFLGGWGVGVICMSYVVYLVIVRDIYASLVVGSFSSVVLCYKYINV